MLLSPQVMVLPQDALWGFGPCFLATCDSPMGVGAGMADGS